MRLLQQVLFDELAVNIPLRYWPLCRGLIHAFGLRLPLQNQVVESSCIVSSGPCMIQTASNPGAFRLPLPNRLQKVCSCAKKEKVSATLLVLDRQFIGDRHLCSQSATCADFSAAIKEPEMVLNGLDCGDKNLDLFGFYRGLGVW